MSCIKDTAADIDNFKISISEVVVIYSPKNVDSQVWPYLAIMNHHSWEKEKLRTLSDLLKILEDEKMGLSNQDKGIANFAQGS